MARFKFVKQGSTVAEEDDRRVRVEFSIDRQAGFGDGGTNAAKSARIRIRRPLRSFVDAQVHSDSTRVGQLTLYPVILESISDSWKTGLMDRGDWATLDITLDTQNQGREIEIVAERLFVDFWQLTYDADSGRMHEDLALRAVNVQVDGKDKLELKYDERGNR